MSFRRILFATDFSAWAREAGFVAAELSAMFKAPLHCIHVIQFPNLVLPEGAVLITPDTMTTILDEAGRRLAETRQALTKAGAFEVSTSAPEGNPVHEILRRAEHDQVDLIVLGSHGRTGLGRMLLGSVAERVVRKATCAVLTVRSRGVSQT
jgi:nucleotide-binding universal stress UspA family protein